VASKTRFQAKAVTPTDSARGALLLVEHSNWRFLASYFPQLNAKRAFFNVCIDQAAYSESVPFLLMGDLNTGKNSIDVEGKGVPFVCADLFEALSTEARLIDLWRLEHGDKKEWSWRSRVNGFRVDHALANKQFMKRFIRIRCAYDHTPRENGLTDRSALILSFNGE
jgi:exonuclease III